MSEAAILEPPEKCDHQMRELSSKECHEHGIPHWGMCWHVYQCKKCGKIESRDSSD